MSRLQASVLAAIGLTIAVPALAQHAPAVEQALAGQKLMEILGVEPLLFDRTQKTTTVIFLKRYGYMLEGKTCREAMFGSRQANYVIDYEARTANHGRTPQQWKAEGCDQPGAFTIVDLR